MRLNWFTISSKWNGTNCTVSDRSGYPDFISCFFHLCHLSFSKSRSNNIHINSFTGEFTGTVAFGLGTGDTTTLVSAGDSDVFAAKLDADGNLLWAQCAGGEDIQAGNAVAGLSGEKLVVVGDFWGSATFGEGEDATTLQSAGSRDIFISTFTE